MIRKLPFMLIALCFLLSCGGGDPLDIKPEQPEKPSEPEEPKDPEKPETKNKRIKTLKIDRPPGLFTEDKVTYDEQGRITRIESHIENDGWLDLPEYDIVTKLTWNDIEVVNEMAYEGKSDKQILRLNKTGCIEKLLIDGEWWSDTYEYWGSGHLKIKAGFFSYRYEDGNLVNFKCVEESKCSNYIVESGSIPNKAGISSILLSGEYNTLGYPLLDDYDFDIAIHNSFYLYYSGLYGKPSKNLETSVTHGEYSLYFEYELDEEGYPKKIYCTELDNGMPIPSTESEEAFTASIEYWED